MTIAREEIFGPVLATIEFADVDEAIARANDSQYGLAAAVWTRDIKKAHYVARKLQAGTVWINTYNVYDTAAPFGGYKSSGFGREMSAHALEHYTQVKTVWVDSERVTVTDAHIHIQPFHMMPPSIAETFWKGKPNRAELEGYAADPRKLLARMDEDGVERVGLSTTSARTSWDSPTRRTPG